MATTNTISEYCNLILFCGPNLLLFIKIITEMLLLILTLIEPIYKYVFGPKNKCSDEVKSKDSFPDSHDTKDRKMSKGNRQRRNLKLPDLICQTKLLNNKYDKNMAICVDEHLKSFLNKSRNVLKKRCSQIEVEPLQEELGEKAITLIQRAATLKNTTESITKKEVFKSNLKIMPELSIRKNKPTFNLISSILQETKLWTIDVINGQEEHTVRIQLNFEVELEDGTIFISKILKKNTNHQKSLEICPKMLIKLNNNEMVLLQKIAQIIVHFSKIILGVQSKNKLKQKMNISKPVKRNTLVRINIKKDNVTFTSRARYMLWKISSGQSFHGEDRTLINKRKHISVSSGSLKNCCSTIIKDEQKHLSPVADMCIQLSRINCSRPSEYNQASISHSYCKIKNGHKKLSPIAEMYIRLSQY